MDPSVAGWEKVLVEAMQTTRDGMEKDLITSFDNSARLYDAWYDAQPLLFEIELMALRKLCPTPSVPALEVGVGSGRFANALQIEFGLDPSMELLRIAKSRAIKAVQAKGEAIPFRNETFGSVFIVFTLCFVQRASAVIKECCRVLKPSGELTVACFNRNSPWGLSYEEKRQAGHPLYRHATFFSPEEIRNLLLAEGLAIEKTMSTLLLSPGEVSRLEVPEEDFKNGAGVFLIRGRKTR